MDSTRLLIKLKRYHYGQKNAVSSKELEAAFLVSGKKIRNAVNTLRRDGEPICSDGDGYFYAKTEPEVRATIHHMKRRISGISAAIAGLNRSLGRFDKMQTRLPLEGGDEY